MKRTLWMAAVISTLACSMPAAAIDGDAVIGGALGGAAGAAVGSAVGGRNGAVIGAGIGGAAGAAVATSGKKEQPREVVYVEKRHEHHDNGHHYGQYKQKHGHHGNDD
jgi:outer membrane lipoprotein SlyB